LDSAQLRDLTFVLSFLHGLHEVNTLLTQLCCNRPICAYRCLYYFTCSKW